MRLIIAGSRELTDQNIIDKAVENGLKAFGLEVSKISTVLSGTARGADSLGEAWAKNNGIKIERHPADWNNYGRRAGPIRNEIMADSADLLVAVWDGSSRGTASMIGLAKAEGLAVYVHRFTR